VRECRRRLIADEFLQACLYLGKISGGERNWDFLIAEYRRDILGDFIRGEYLHSVEKKNPRCIARRVTAAP